MSIPHVMPVRGPHSLALTTIALVAFAGNSVLCRMALKHNLIDALSFSTIRLISGAVALLAIFTVLGRGSQRAGSWVSASMLFLYAVSFSFAYVSLETATGALILFGAVQATMIGGALISGDRPSPLEWLGWLLAMGGLIYLLSPGLARPSPVGSVLMGLAGLGWGVYSLRGRKEESALAGTTFNFIRCLPMVLLLALVGMDRLQASIPGAFLAAVSGALTSGVGYAVWYQALRGLSAMQASMVQLSVPALAALAGVFLLSEDLTQRLLLSGAFILGGISVAVLAREKLSESSVKQD